jgi:hypothetical protein
MTRPVRPTALVLLTVCMVYPGVTLLYQGVYPFVAGEWFNLVGSVGPWFDLATRWGVPLAAVSGLKAALGAAWIAGVLGLWAGDWKAYPLTLLAALGTLLCPVGPTVMAVLAIALLVFFRENPAEIPA